MTLNIEGSIEVVWNPFQGNDKSVYGKTDKGRLVDMEDNDDIFWENLPVGDISLYGKTSTDIVGIMVLFDGRLCYIEGCDRDVGITLTVNNNGKKDYYFCAQGRAFSKGNGKIIPGEPDYDVLEDFIDRFYEQVCYGVRCGGIPVVPDKIITNLVNNIGIGVFHGKPTAEDCPFNQ